MVSMKQGTLVAVVAAVAVGGCGVSAAWAQLSNLGTPQGANNPQDLSTGLSYQQQSQASTAGSGTFSLSQRGDWTYGPTTVVEAGRVATDSWITFSVGPIPVQVTSLSLAYSSKVAVGGGNDRNIISVNPFYDASIFEDNGTAGPGGGDIPVGFNTSYVSDTPLAWNQFREFSGSEAATSATILAANTSYYLRLRSLVNISISRIGSPQAGITVTHEFGGTLTQGAYSGFLAQVSYRTVPSAPTAVLLAMGGLVGMRRRR
jgi:hypothetical protein